MIFTAEIILQIQGFASLMAWIDINFWENSGLQEMK